MPKLEYFLLCESVSVDQETNRISLFNILEDFQLQAKGQPPEKPHYILSQCVAVALFNREQEDGDREFTASLHFNSMEAGHPIPELKFKMERNRQRIIMRFVGMPPVDDNGVLQFKLFLDGEHCASHTVHLQAGS
ncbi:MAG: hypothetical protein R3C09_19715 [Pirellulaceae bacterium]|jgi:hypothetical protein